MFEKPQQEHQWLEHLAGEWVFESECHFTPGESPQKGEGYTTCRVLGGLWAILEGGGDSPESGAWSTIMTIGYNPLKKKYQGTFLGSMMTHLWIYDGTLDSSGKKLVLDTEGPKFGESAMAKYQDIIELENDGQWKLWSQMQDENGNWTKLMEAIYRRK